VVQAFLLAPPLLSVIAGVFICKLLAVLASSGSGAPGGVFTPTLFVGMATGMLFAQLFALWFRVLRRRFCWGWREWQRCWPPPRMRRLCRR
jgi:H+/Cl- antiporter ClcA